MTNWGDIGDIVEISRVGEHGISVEWRIHDVLSLDGGKDDSHRSPVFTLGDGDDDEDEERTEWCLRLYPEWKREERRPASRSLRLALYRYDLGPAKTFHATVGIRGSGGVEKSREVEMEFCVFGVGCYSYFWDDFCSRSELIRHKRRLMPNDTLTITCVIKRIGVAREADIVLRYEKNILKSGEDSKVTLEEQDSIASCYSQRRFEKNVLKSGEDSKVTLEEQALDELQSSLQSLLKSEEDCDVVIKVQGKEFRAHRSILRARSPVFQAMFSHDMVEKQKGVVTMEECDQDVFPAFLEHIYTGSLGVISAGNVFGLYTSSKKYDLKTLKKACAKFMKENLTVSSFCDAITLAVKHDDKELIEHATEFFCKNTLDIVKTAGWQIFLAENPTVGNELYIKQLTK